MNTLHRKINLNQHFQNGAAIIDPVSSKRAPDPDQFTTAADSVRVERNS